MSISAQDVKTLREQTGAGMMDCKKALQETGGDFEKAIDFLKKTGLAKAAKKSSRVAAEGLVFSKVTPEKAVLAEVNCETDFVSKNEDFQKFGEALVNLIHSSDVTDIEGALELSMNAGTVSDKIKSLIAVIGENINFRRMQVIQPTQGKLGHYIHTGGKIVVVAEATGNLDEGTIKDVCMQVAAMSPQFVDKSQVPQDILEREKKIFKEQLLETGKPEEVVEKILVGKLDKFAGEISLLQQTFVKDSKKTVAQFLKDQDPQATITRFVRMGVGEGVEKREDDFAAEVAKMTGS